MTEWLKKEDKEEMPDENIQIETREEMHEDDIQFEELITENDPPPVKRHCLMDSIANMVKDSIECM